MSSRDTRVVELQFDNKSFESGVESTIKSLDKLDKNLDTIDGKSLKNLNDAIKDVNFKGMEDSLSSLSDKFSAMGQIAQGIFRGIGEDVYNLGKQVIGNTVGQVISGGKSRALNIAQAEFMFEGVVGAENIQKAMDNANHAVEGTAYGLDEAAIAASQLAASGVKLGDDMEEALKAISGVAAMTGSEYSDIARIFTTVAGNGKLMTQQLNQLGGRGLNVAAKMAEYFKVSEEEFRAMVSDKKTVITFQDLYKATSSYFEQAARANNLYTGALSNMKSALSRVGQPVMTQWYESARDVLNAVRPWVNKFKKTIQPLYDFIEARMKTLTGKITEPFLAAFDKNGELVKPEIAENFAKIGDIIQNVLESIWNIGSLVFGVIKNIRDAFTEVFGSDIIDMILNVTQKIKEFTAMLSGANDVGDKSSALYGAVPSIMSGIKTIATGLFTIIKSLKDVLSSIFNIVAPLFTNIVVPAFNFLASTGLTILGRISEYISKLFGHFGKIKKINLFGITVEDALKSAGEAINKFSGTAVEKINWFFDNLNKLPDLFKNLWKNVKKFFTKNLGGLSKFFKNFSSNLSKFKKEVGDSTIVASLNKLGTAIKNFFSNLTLEKVLNKFVNAFTNFKDTLKTIFEFLSPVIGGVIDLIKSLADNVKETLGGKAGENLLSGGILAALIMLLKRMKDIKELVKTFKSFKEGALDILKKFGNILKSYQNSIDAANLKTLAVAIGILAGSILVLSLLDTKKVVQVSGILMVLGGALSYFLKTFSKTEKVQSAGQIIKDATKTIAGGITTFLKTLGDALGKAISKTSTMLALDMFTFAILEIAAAIRMLTSVNWKESWPAIAAIILVLGGMMAIFVYLQKLSAKMEVIDIKKLLGVTSALAIVAIGLGRSMLAISTSMVIFAAAWKISAGGFIAGTIAMAGLMFVIGTVMERMASVQTRFPQMLGMAVAITALSASMILIATGLAAMAGALYLINLIDPWGIVTGLAVLVTAIGSIAAAGKYTKGSWKEILAMGVMANAFALAVVVLSGAFAIVSAMKSGLGAFLLVMASFVGVMALMGQIGKTFGQSIVKVGQAFALFGVGALAFSVAVTLVIAAVVALQALGPLLAAAASGMAVAMTAFITTLSSLSGPLSAAISNIAKRLIESLLTSLETLLGPTLDTVGKMLVQALDTLQKYAPDIIDKLVTLIVTVFDKLTTRIPELVDSIWDFLTTLGSAIKAKIGPINPEMLIGLLGFAAGMGLVVKGFAKMKDDAVKALPVVGVIGLILIELVAAFSVMDALDTQGVIATAAGFSAVIISVAGMLALLSKFKVNIGGAVKAALAVGLAFDIILGVVGVVLVGLGALVKEVKGVKDYLEAGVEVAEIVGSAIGRFIGALAGGILTSIGHGIENIGTSLSKFWTNASTFFEGIKSLDANAVDSAKKLGEVLLILGSAELLDSVAKLLGADANYDALGESLGAFAGAVVSFADTITEAELDEDTLKKVNMAAKISLSLANVAAVIPKNGGMWQDFFGEADLERFGKSLKAYGGGLVKFANSVVTLEPAHIKAAKVAVKIGRGLAELNKSIPKTGGIWQEIAGNQDLDIYGSKMSVYGHCLWLFCDSVKSLEDKDVDQAKLASAIGMELTKLSDSINPENGIWQGIVGTQDVATFGTTMYQYSNALIEFLKNLQPLNEGHLRVAKLSTMIASEVNGVISQISTETMSGGIRVNLLSNYSTGIKKYAEGLKVFAEKADGLKLEPFELAYWASYRLAPIMKGLQEALGKGFDGKFFNQTTGLGLASFLTNLASGLEIFAEKAATLKLEPFKNAAAAAGYIAPMMLSLKLAFGFGFNFKNFTKETGQDLGDFLTNVITGLTDFSEGAAEIDFEKFKMALNVVRELAVALNTYETKTGEVFIEAMKQISGTSIQNFIDEFETGAAVLKGQIESFFYSLIKFISGQAKTVGRNSVVISDMISRGTTSKLDETVNAVKLFLNALLKAFIANQPLFYKASSESVSSYAKGMQSDQVKNLIVSAGTTVSMAFYKSLDNSNEMYEAGVNAIKGFLWGAVSKVDDGTVGQTFYNIGIEALKAAMKALAEKSPSRKFMEVGENAVLGLVIGVQDNIKKVSDQGTSIGQNLLDAFKNASDNVAGLVTDELNLDPTITPVIDLSELQNGIYGANLLLNGIHTSPINLAGSNIDHIVSLEGNRYNDSNVIKAIDDLNAKLDDLSAQLANLQIVLDSGALVGELSPGINKNFGKMDVLSQRGVM